MELPEGFVKHDGGPRPVARGRCVDVMFRDGDIESGRRADNWHWPWNRKRQNSPLDIIAYRPTEGQQQ